MVSSTIDNTHNTHHSSIASIIDDEHASNTALIDTNFSIFTICISCSSFQCKSYRPMSEVDCDSIANENSIAVQHATNSECFDETLLFYYI